MYLPVESLDYEVVDNINTSKQEIQAWNRWQILRNTFLKWTLACCVGVLTGITGVAMNLAVENIAGFKLHKVAQFLEHERLGVAFGILVGSNLVLVVFSVLLCVYIGPAAAGSGIPELKAYLNGVNSPDIFAPKTLFVKVVGCIGSVAGGLDAGKQGPLVHTGACIAALLSQGGSESHFLPWRWLRSLKNDRDRRDFVTCGAAAGLAAAFRAPIGGVLFALEEVQSWWRNALLWRAFLTTALVAVVLQTAITYCGDSHCGVYGHGGLIMFNVGKVPVEFGLIELVPVVALGVIGGFLGSLFTFLNSKIVEMYSTWYKKRHGSAIKIVVGVLISLVTSVCTLGLPWLGTCRACPSDNADEACSYIISGGSGSFRQFTCPNGYYNDLATLLFSSNDDVVRKLFSVGTASVFHYSSLILHLAASFTLALVTYGTPIPSGLFIPIIISGATYGRVVGMLMRTSSLNGFSKLDEGLYAILGAASLLGGSLRVTMSVCVILLELTNNLLMLPLTMLVLFISKTIGDSLNSGLYDQLLRIKRLPFLQEHPQPYMKYLTAYDVCTRSLVTLRAKESVSNILDVLERTSHSAFPVMSDQALAPDFAPFIPSQKTSTFHGLILRAHLLQLARALPKEKLSKSRSLVSSTTVLPSSFRSLSDHQSSSSSNMTLSTTTKRVEELIFTISTSTNSGNAIILEPSLSGKERLVDLLPFTNASPFTVVDSMSLAKAYTLFRGLGLRHLCVVPSYSTLDSGSPIVGILTRQDFLPEHVFSLFPHLNHHRGKRQSLVFSFLKKAVKSHAVASSV